MVFEGRKYQGLGLVIEVGVIFRFIEIFRRGVVCFFLLFFLWFRIGRLQKLSDGVFRYISYEMRFFWGVVGFVLRSLFKKQVIKICLFIEAREKFELLVRSLCVYCLWRQRLRLIRWDFLGRIVNFYYQVIGFGMGILVVLQFKVKFRVFVYFRVRLSFQQLRVRLG